MNMMDKDIIISVLKDIPIFKDLTASQIDSMKNLLKVEKYLPNQLIVKENDIADKVYVIYAGTADVMHEDQVLASIGKGDTIGELALMDSEIRSADVKSTSEITLVSLDLKKLEKISEKEVPLGVALKLNCAIKIANYLRGSNLKTLSDRKKHRNEIAQLTNYDTVTGLPNQHFFSEKLKECIANYSVVNHVVYQIELIEFKEISDAMGADFADEFLNEFSEKLDSIVPDNTLIARVGMNQFMLLIENIIDLVSLSHLAKKILNIMISGIRVRDEDVFVNGYIGIAQYPDDGKTSAMLMRNAGLALDAAKLNEQNSYAFYNPDFNAAIESRRALIKDFRTAVEDDQFEIYYQPQVSIKDKKLIGAEALIRWPHPTQGMIPPSVFIPIVEQNGLIITLGNWILKTACAQVHMWKNANLPFMPKIAINLSALQFRQKDFVEMIKELVNYTRINPGMIELEITESVVMNDIDETITKVKKLADMGFMIAIDDFGTGYSSLSYLRKLPIGKLKIDQSFVRELFLSDEAKDIVRCIVLLAQNLKLITIAEGVETEEQYEFLKELGCDEGQGYLFSQPISTSQFEKDFLLKRTV